MNRELLEDVRTDWNGLTDFDAARHEAFVVFLSLRDSVPLKRAGCTSRGTR
jgi:hypothetical protein